MPNNYEDELIQVIAIRRIFINAKELSKKIKGAWGFIEASKQGSHEEEWTLSQTEGRRQVLYHICDKVVLRIASQYTAGWGSFSAVAAFKMHRTSVKFGGVRGLNANAVMFAPKEIIIFSDPRFCRGTEMES